MCSGSEFFTRLFHRRPKLTARDSCLPVLQTDLQRFVWDVNGFFLKEGKMLCFQIKSTCLIALLYSLLFARVSGRFEAFSAS